MHRPCTKLLRVHRWRLCRPRTFPTFRCHKRSTRRSPGLSPRWNKYAPCGRRRRSHPFFQEYPMLFMVHMIVNIPATLPADEAARIKAEEKQYSQDLQRSGKWPHIWRVVGEYANVSIFDVASNDELHDALSKLPLFPYMSLKVTPLAKH